MLNDRELSEHLATERNEFEALFFLQKQEYEVKIRNVVAGMNAQFEKRFNAFAEGLQESEMYLQCERQTKYIEELTSKVILQEVALAVQRTALAQLKQMDKERLQAADYVQEIRARDELVAKLQNAIRVVQQERAVADEMMEYYYSQLGGMDAALREMHSMSHALEARHQADMHRASVAYAKMKKKLQAKLTAHDNRYKQLHYQAVCNEMMKREDN